MFVKNEIEEIERAGQALDHQPLLRAAFVAGGLNLSQVLELSGTEELEHDLGAGRATSGGRVIAPV
jgi:hypothetical protein